MTTPNPLQAVGKMITDESNDQIFRATVVELTTTGFTVARDGSVTAEGPYPFITSVDAAVGDQVLVQRVGAGYVVIGRILNDATPGPIKYLVGEATEALDNEIVTGLVPAGDLNNTWDDPLVNTTHSGSSHAGVIASHVAAGDPHPVYWLDADALGGELGGTLAAATVDSVHSGSAHHSHILASLATASGTVALGTSYADIPSAAITPAAGTYLLLGSMSGDSNTSGVTITAAIRDGAGGVYNTNQMMGQNGAQRSAPAAFLMAVVTANGSTTYKISAILSSGTGTGLYGFIGAVRIA